MPRGLQWLPCGCAAIALLFAGACQSTSEADVSVVDANAAAIDARDFPAPRGMKKGVALRTPRGSWRVGDEVLYGLRLVRGETTRHWLLKLSVLEVAALDEDGERLPETTWRLRINGERTSFMSSLARVAATVYDEEGAELGRTEPLLPRDFLDRGVADACAQVMERTTNPPGTLGLPSIYRDIDPNLLSESTVCAVALLQIVQEDSVLAPLLWQVIEKPSLWSVLGNLGARVVLRPRYHAVTEAMCPLPGRYETTWRLPMELHVNDTLALDMNLFVTESSPPYALGGGLLGASAKHPSDPDLEFSLLLLSATIGGAAE
ncbi:MAG: hypothetical protein AB8H80_12125 [Planctomycetota bacterium]